MGSEIRQIESADLMIGKSMRLEPPAYYLLPYTALPCMPSGDLDFVAAIERAHTVKQNLAKLNKS